MRRQRWNVAYAWTERLISFYRVSMFTAVRALKNGNFFKTLGQFGVVTNEHRLTFASIVSGMRIMISVPFVKRI